MQLHEGEVVGRKTCVKALLRACLLLDSRLRSLAEVLETPAVVAVAVSIVSMRAFFCF